MEKPPIIKPPLRAKGIILSLIRHPFLQFMVAGFGILVFLAYLIRPHYPKADELIQNFYAHRVTYEKLRDMFQADGHVNRITSRGVVVTNSAVSVHFAIKPQEAGFPIERYNEYLVLFKQAGVLAASRREYEQSSDPIFLVWTWGAIDTFRYIGVCWKNQEPTNQVASLYQRLPDREKGKGVYKQIEGHWYLWMKSSSN